MGPLIILALFGVENGQDVLVVVALSHVDIAHEIAHEETVLSLVDVIHHFILVIGVHEILLEPNELLLRLCHLTTVVVWAG